MSTILIDLEDRIITDDGQTVAKHSLLMKKALSGEVFTNLPALNEPETKWDLEQYNRFTEKDQIQLWVDDGEFVGPDAETYEWTIPEKYRELDIIELSVQRLEERGLTSEEYIDRLGFELEQMEKRDMFPFLRCLVYVIDMFREKGVVWGVGRGSSCASLVMFVLGINRVDPIKYDIPAEEFFK